MGDSINVNLPLCPELASILSESLMSETGSDTTFLSADPWLPQFSWFVGSMSIGSDVSHMSV